MEECEIFATQAPKERSGSRKKTEKSAASDVAYWDEKWSEFLDQFLNRVREEQKFAIYGYLQESDTKTSFFADIGRACFDRVTDHILLGSRTMKAPWHILLDMAWELGCTGDMAPNADPPSARALFYKKLGQACFDKVHTLSGQR